MDDELLLPCAGNIPGLQLRTCKRAWLCRYSLKSQSEFESGRRARSRRANQAATPRLVKLSTSVRSNTVSRCCITCVSLIRFAKPTEQSRAVRTMPTMISCFIWLLILSRLGVATLSLRKLSSLHPKPTCEPHEPCRIGFLGMEFCTCPGDRKCPHSSESSLFYQDVEYHFCDEAKFHICEEGEVAWVKKGLHQIVNCICPEPFVLHGELWNPAEDMSQYKCLPVLQYSCACCFEDNSFAEEVLLQQRHVYDPQPGVHWREDDQPRQRILHLPRRDGVCRDRRDDQKSANRTRAGHFQVQTSRLNASPTLTQESSSTSHPHRTAAPLLTSGRRCRGSKCVRLAKSKEK
ncbi:hypothetical protein Tsp_01948 [Trichinella spiralis]|uniref:hypothetical protein n=1 Tax=Trichinella spiralis TaxID=6334 RepID=UPI0001EFB702|nr:hypothetical protein Tsp_01948 [Trichinella spiralis]